MSCGDNDDDDDFIIIVVAYQECKWFQIINSFVWIIIDFDTQLFQGVRGGGVLNQIFFLKYENKKYNYLT